MKITDLLSASTISLDVKLSSKEEVLDTVTQLMYEAGNISQKESYKQALLKREEESTTGVGNGIAIPHGRCDEVIKPSLCMIRISNGVDYNSLDQKPVYLVFGIAVNNESSSSHIEILSKLSTLLMDQSFVDALLNATTVDEVLQIIDDKDNDKKEKSGYDQNLPYVLAVTACPTGIAHTYMAAESLQLKAKEMRVNIKVETNGSTGVKNELTQDDIQSCIGVIVAADKAVEMARFNGVPVLSTKVQDGIHKPQDLIQDILDQKVPTYHCDEVKQEKKKIELGLYNHLMNGLSNLLPFAVGSGILIAVSYLIDDASINALSIGYNTPAAALFSNLGNITFMMMLPVLSGYIASSISDRPAFMPGLIGGLIAYLGVSISYMFNGGSLVTSGIIGAIVAGYLAGYLILLIKKLTFFIPDYMDGVRPMLIYPVLGLLSVGLIMMYINPMLSTINTYVGTLLSNTTGISALILGAALGGMMSVDMGGPFNKTAYVIGVGALTFQTTAGYNAMASVMVGGMIPPLVIALSSILFKNKFTIEERKPVIKNTLMGLSFISEAAIPYATKDPNTVIPACTIASAIAGGFSQYFNCTLYAPHGGIFVFVTVGNGDYYLLSLLIGTIIGAIILGVLKKPISK